MLLVVFASLIIFIPFLVNGSPSRISLGSRRKSHIEDVVDCEELLGQVKTLRSFRTYTRTPHQVKTIPSDPKVRLFQADMLFPDLEFRLLRDRSAFENFTKEISPKLRWPNKTVYYYIDETAFDAKSSERRMIEKSIAFLEQETCLKFIHIDPRAIKHVHFIHVIENMRIDYCYSNLGYQGIVNPRGGRAQPLSLRRPACFHPGTIQHEFLHALGIDHEQNRPDRDDHICVYYRNIRRNASSQFYIWKGLPTFGLSYDYGSVMQYGHTFFGAKDKHGLLKITMLAKKNPNICLGQNLKATQCDLEKIRQMYDCSMRKVCVPTERLPPCPPNTL